MQSKDKKFDIKFDTKESQCTEEKISDEEVARKAKLRCMKLLEYSDRTEQQLRRKLKESGFPQNAVDEAILYVKQFHYLDDSRFAGNYVMQQSSRKSVRRMTQELMQKGVEASCIEDVLEQYRDKEEEAAARVLVKHMQGKDFTQDKVRWGLVRYLTGKGFPYDMSRRLVQDYSSQPMDEFL